MRQWNLCQSRGRVRVRVWARVRPGAHRDLRGRRRMCGERRPLRFQVPQHPGIIQVRAGPIQVFLFCCNWSILCYTHKTRSKNLIVPLQLMSYEHVSVFFSKIKSCLIFVGFFCSMTCLFNICWSLFIRCGKRSHFGTHCFFLKWQIIS